MKKILLLVAIACVAFVGCQKEGVYNPSKKISKIYSETYYNDTIAFAKHVDQDWHWDGNKLTSIDYYNSGTERFRYDGNRIIEASTAWGRLVYTYEHKKLAKVELYKDSDRPLMSVDVTHDGKHVTALDITFTNGAGIYSSKEGEGRHLSIFTGILPMEMLPLYEEVEEQLMQQSLRKADSKEHWDLVWEDGNLKSIITGVSNSATKNFTYDNKKNPFLGLFTFYNEYNYRGSFISSRNNITGYEQFGDNVMSYNEEYLYEYDGDYPIKKTIYRPNAVVRGGVSVRSTTDIYYYEYE